MKAQYKKWLKPAGRNKLRFWIGEGLTHERIAHNMNIESKTLYRWARTYPEIDKALNGHKDNEAIILTDEEILKYYT